MTLDAVDSVLQECIRQAKNGADEGTLVWAHEQTEACGRFGHAWHSPRGNLYCALLLRPEFPARLADQLTYIAAISAGTALAGLVSPMTGLRYRWPNDLVMNDGKVAGILLDAPTPRNDSLDWLAIGLAVNIASYPTDTPFPALSVHAVDGSTEITPTAVLEEYARYFLSWLNRWAEDGFDAILKTWRLRADNIGEQIEIQLADGNYEGNFMEVNGDGAMVLEQLDGTHRVISTSEFFDLNFDSPRESDDSHT